MDVPNTDFTRPHDSHRMVSDDEIGKARGDCSPPLSLRQWNGWANFVVCVMLSVGPFPRLAR